MAIATFGAGCFWGVEELFRTTHGVSDTEVGYMGGSTEKPTYEEVCTDKTGHAEVVQVEFDPDLVSYGELVDIFFDNHNPTELNRQGPDEGTQYRSAIFYHDEAQRVTGEEKKAALAASGRFKKPVVTEVTKAQTFWAAEDYHQEYLAKRGLSHCHI
ncbi:peptide-methionine (S)-S-oxide reductase MsrA [Gimibacter soli]|uniref:Peptide methionine sulfoxide reductase MsrA n=1 Tax=Gimibacter soli TaxID=3024400 RepID=A0AAE9XNY8_9PROT|nr:peptide-methionine (S)-S-oxide reductase MsrA [Gimibacter soli]WCL53542.1 peptide-methionine (S)-S-oxide reductase MsrA [Gimibacter soli]